MPLVSALSRSPPWPRFKRLNCFCFWSVSKVYSWLELVCEPHLLLLTPLIVGMCLSNEVQIFLVKHRVLFFSFLSPALLSLASSGPALFIICFFIFVYDEAFTDL